MSSGINWDGGGIPDAAHLRTLPDGTIISWLRVPGDRTSEAVAFVRREVSNESGFPQVDVWISPGGWDPQTIESAGVSFPAHVVRFGEFNPEHYLGAELPLLSELASGVLDHGGTWAREKALECASRAWAGMSAVRDRNGAIVETAKVFEQYLDPEPEPEALEQAPSLGELAEQLRALAAVGVTRAALMYAVNQVWHESSPPVALPGTVGEAIGNLRSALDVHADITTLRSHATHLLHVIDLWRNQK
ncbi:hypothetical protein KNT58_gp56 [Mycobacterium phage Fortunato]|uniref:Uncharacterized protein n=1 Tax=Mycobacterium phage Fortunato TaxID=1882439 RepID=A0A1D8EYG4_9CAUD|nr:hypothetical protein KNT58_gp56 [Mycobacterium phage Fortunato]AOT27273.1 hypothetical protein SEA_FORTUNATO_56 [Mycobacterium phage Fortunato]